MYFGIKICVWLITKQTTSRRQNVDKTVTNSTQDVIIQLKHLKVNKKTSQPHVPLNVTQSVSKLGVFLETPQQWYNSSAVSQGAVEASLSNLLLLHTADSFVKYLSSSFHRTTLVHVATFSLVALRPDSGSWPPLRGIAITLIRHTTLGRTRRDEWPARCRDLYLTTHNNNNKQTTNPPARFEPSSATSERSSNVMSRLRAVRPVNRNTILNRSRYSSLSHKVHTDSEAHPAFSPRIYFQCGMAIW